MQRDDDIKKGKCVANMMIPVPRMLYDAFEHVHAAGTKEETFEAFVSQWGGLEPEHFVQALKHGSGDDRIVSFFALPAMEYPHSTELLTPFLESPSQQERCASAYCLAKIDAKSVASYLEAWVLECCSFERRKEVDQQGGGVWWEMHWCCAYLLDVIPRLSAINIPSLIPLLRSAFQSLLRIEKELDFFFFEWHAYDALAHALGEHGAFSALADIDMPLPHREMMMINMAFGFLQIEESKGTRFSDYLNNDKTVRQQVGALLQQHFGLSVEEQEQVTDWLHFSKNAKARERWYAKKGATDWDAIDWDEEWEEEEQEEKEPIVPGVLVSYKGPQPDLSRTIGDLAPLTWSPDGTRIVSGGADATAQVWDAFTGQPLLVFQDHTASVNAVAWSPDGQFIATGGSDSLVYVWNAVTGTIVTDYRGHQGWIYRGLAWSPDGTHIVSASWDKTVQVWEAMTGKHLLTYRNHPSVVNCVAWSPDGQHIVSGGGYPDASIQVWDARTGDVRLIYREHQTDKEKIRPVPATFDDHEEELARGPSGVYSVAWSPDGQLIASAGLRWLGRVWDATTGQTVMRADQMWGPMIWSHDETAIISNHDGELEQRNARTGIALVRYDVGTGQTCALALSPDGNRLAGDISWGTINVWDISTENL